MHPKIVESFWTDLDFEAFAGQELANHRLTFLWTFAGPITNAAGIFPLNRRAFTGDTGLPFDQLLATMNAFPRAYTIDEASKHALVRNYIRYQIGTGAKLQHNNIFKAVLAALRTAPRALVAEIAQLYPETKPFTSPSQALAKPFVPHGNDGSSPPNSDPSGKPLPSPSEALAKGSAKAKAKEKEKAVATADRAHEAGVAIPTLAEIERKAEMLPIAPEHIKAVALDFWNWHDSRGWMSGNTPLHRPLNLLHGYYGNWLERRKNKPGASARLDAGASADDLRAELQTASDPTRRAALEKQLAALHA
ncbi:MAG TPA: hypothetical protein VGF13_01120 [Verrucomicrobiae bacterium]|jgi:hypothetical protein